MTLVKDHHRIAVWFSCGAASAVALKLTVERYGAERVRAVNNPIAEEDADNSRFRNDVATWVGVEIEDVRSKEYPSQSCKDVWDQRGFMSGPKGAPCTMILKKWARQQWCDRNDVDWHVFGFTADETARYDSFVSSEIENVIPVLPLAEMTKQDCFDYVMQAGLELPRVYAMGYPNANCIGCVKATSPTYWNHVKRVHPEVFSDRAEQSRRIGAKLVRVKGKRIFLDELKPTDLGAPMSEFRVECGVTCEEKGPAVKKNGLTPMETWKMLEMV